MPATIHEPQPDACPSAEWARLAAVLRSYGITPVHLRLTPGLGSEAIAALTPLLAR